MHLAFDIFQGIGIAVACGIRPFLPGLAAGLLGLAGVEIHFDHTKLHFLQGVVFLLILAVLAVALIVWEASKRGGEVDDLKGVGTWALGVLGAVIGALFFAGSLCRGGYVTWPGYAGGAVVALLAVLAARPFLARLRSRLDAEAAALGVPLIAEGAALLTAILSVVAPPVGVIALIAVLVFIWRNRGTGDRKYAGLRILR